MSEGIQRLVHNLKQQIAVYEQIYALEQEKKDALVRNNIQDIENVTARLGKLLRTVGRLENERISCVESVARDLGRTPEDLKLAELSGHFPVLNEVRPGLEHVVRQIQDIQSTNAQLLIQAIRVVNYTLDLLTYEQGHTYAPPDAKTNRSYEETKKKQIMDWRV